MSYMIQNSGFVSLLELIRSKLSFLVARVIAAGGFAAPDGATGAAAAGRMRTAWIPFWGHAAARPTADGWRRRPLPVWSMAMMTGCR